MNWLKQLTSRQKQYSELSEEIREHLDEKTEELIATGMSRQDAAAAARREFGNVSLIEEDSRSVWRWASVEQFFSDVRFGFRILRKNSGFAAVAILTLASRHRRKYGNVQCGLRRFAFSVAISQSRSTRYGLVED